MRLLVFDPSRGAAGDMITGALLHLGADREATLSAMMSVVGEPEVTLVERHGIQSLLVRTRATPSARTYEEVLGRVRASSAPEKAVSMAARVFERIRKAEEEIHGHTTHFHEVGADDAIADVVGACTAFLSLRPDRCAVLPVMLGGGSLSGFHGTYPAPAPATLAILRESGLPVRFGSPEDGELCTPTGAALLSEFWSGVPPNDQDCVITRTGYGAGMRDPPGVANVLRAILVECSDPLHSHAIDLLETNTDDVSAEIIAHTISRLMDEGAYDASAIPCTMKKGRPGHLVRVIAAPGDGARLAVVMAEELGTLGVRSFPAIHRFTAERTVREVTVTFQGKERTIRVKCGMIQGRPVSLKAEYEDIRAWARDLGVPARILARVAESQAWDCVEKEEWPSHG